ncbi:MAG: hypothetical protein DMF65_12645 [Acidobacteria bacterium]|nr:MAG: hypothetical protein DMF65_12645 [Acidobacteriota bacterium]
MERDGGATDRLRELRDEIKRRIDYRAFYTHYCPDARQTGPRLQSLCPIPAHAHSGKGHPSLSVDLQQGLFNCFSRDEGGDAITFYELMHGVTFARAVRELARELGITGRKGRRPSLASASAPDAEAAVGESFEPLDAEQMSEVCSRFLEVCRAEDQLEGFNYLARRGIDAATVRRAGVVYFPRRAYRRVMRRMREGFALETLRRGGLFNRREHLTFYHHRLLFPFFVEGRSLYLQARTTAAGVEPRWRLPRRGLHGHAHAPRARLQRRRPRRRGGTKGGLARAARTIPDRRRSRPRRCRTPRRRALPRTVRRAQSPPRHRQTPFRR